MRTSAVIKAELKSLAGEAQAIYNDRSSPVSALKGRLNRLEPQINDLVAELKDVEYVEQARKTYNVEQLAELGGTGAPGADAGPGRFAVPTPRLRLDDAEVHSLWAAATSGETKSVSLGNIGTKAVDTVADPQALNPQLIPGAVGFRRDATRILDLIPTAATGAGSLWYFAATAGATSAGPVAEGATKPQSNPTWSKRVVNTTKLAHWVEVTEEVMEDIAGFSSLIDEELVRGLIDAENDQLLNGTGTSPAMQGILTASGILTRAKGVETSVDTIQQALNDLRSGTSFVPADGIVMSPATYTTMRLLKDANAQYYGGGPFGGSYTSSPTAGPAQAGPPTLWGVPVTLTTKIAVGTALVANFAMATQVWVRTSPKVVANNWGEAQFKANKVLVLAEERLAGVAVTRPTAVCKVTGI